MLGCNNLNSVSKNNEKLLKSKKSKHYYNFIRTDFVYQNNIYKYWTFLKKFHSYRNTCILSL